MDKSQRRLSGKIALTSGQRLKVVVVLTLTVLTVGLFVFEPDNQWLDPQNENIARTKCNSPLSAETPGAPACPADAVTTKNNPSVDLPAYAADVPKIAETYTRSTRVKHAAIARPWHSNSSNSTPARQGPRPGYTMAELCSMGIKGELPFCQVGSFDTKFNISNAESRPNSTSGKISGRVLAASEGGIGGVTIIASPERLKDAAEITAEGMLRFWTVTDTLGAYSLDGLPEGEYLIRSSTHGPYQSARIYANTGVDYADLIVSRNVAAVVEGQVFTANREPLEGVTVLPVLLGQPSVLTGDDGRFSLPVTLKPTINSFGLRFQRPGFSEQSTKVIVQNVSSTNSTGTTSRAPSTITATQVVMHPVESWTALNGAVYSESGEPLTARTVELRPRAAQQKYSTTTDAQGNYSFPVIESPAEYRLTVFGGADHKDYQQDLKMKADTAELNIFLEPYEFGEVTGQVVNQNGAPVADFGLVLRNIGSQKPNVVVRTDDSGYFSIPAAPAGDLIMASQSAPSTLVQGIHLEPGDKMYLPLVLDWGEHEIHGSVVDTHGNPVQASRIVLQWSYQSDGVTTRATRRTAADTQGHFAFSNLGPGPHSLQIAAQGFPTVDIDHDLRRQGYDLTVKLN